MTSAQRPSLVLSRPDDSAQSEASSSPPASPVGLLSRGRALDAVLSKRVLGQGAAIEAVVKAYLRSELPRNNRGPKGIITFLGASGTGKTELAQAFGEALGELETEPYHLETIALNQLQEWKHSTDLFGDSTNMGKLNQVLKKHPRSVLIFDELEKASPSIQIGFLSVLGGLPEVATKIFGISVKEAWFIFTTNAGVEYLDEDPDLAMDRDPFDLLGQAKHRRDRKERDAIPIFAPEFISRLAQGTAAIFRRPAPHHLLALLKQTHPF